MNKLFKMCVLFTGLLTVCQSFAGNIKDGYKSVGYWGNSMPAIDASKAKTDRGNFGDINFKQTIVNHMANTITNIKSHGSVIVEISNSRHGAYEINTRTLLEQVLKRDLSNENVSTNVDIVVLPNDNILLTLELLKTDIVGAIKLSDRVVNIYGYPFVIEGATIPVKDTEVKNIGFILDCNNQYKILNAFAIPDYGDITPSANGRIYFKSRVNTVNRCGMFDMKRFRKLYCYNDKGVFMWSVGNDYDEEWIFGIQETVNTLYAVGAYNNDGLYPLWKKINAKTGEVIQQFKNTTNKGIIFGAEEPNLDTGILVFEKSGVAFQVWDDARIFSLEYVDEDKETDFTGSAKENVVNTPQKVFDKPSFTDDGTADNVYKVLESVHKICDAADASEKDKAIALYKDAYELYKKLESIPTLSNYIHPGSFRTYKNRIVKGLKERGVIIEESTEQSFIQSADDVIKAMNDAADFCEKARATKNKKEIINYYQKAYDLYKKVETDPNTPIYFPKMDLITEARSYVEKELKDRGVKL